MMITSIFLSTWDCVCVGAAAPGQGFPYTPGLDGRKGG